MSNATDRTCTRRLFLSQAAGTALVAGVAPAIVTAEKSPVAPIIGQGDYQYEVLHDWPQLPAKFEWRITHNVAVDRLDNLYVIHQGHAERTEHPTIFVFDPEGSYVRSFGAEFTGGGHGLEVRQEADGEYRYICDYNARVYAKTDLRGERVWQHGVPAQVDAYQEQGKTAAKPFLPTNVTFLDDGGFLLADGYGAFYIHRCDKNGSVVNSFGGAGDGKGTFNTPHGLWIDRRPGRELQLVVTDRAHNTLQCLTLDGEHLETLKGFGLPANVDTHDELLAVSQLHGRVTLLDRNNQVLAHLGDNSEEMQADKKSSLFADPSRWQPGKFYHPHDACFDSAGNLFVAEFLTTGRVTKLRRLA